MPLNFVIMNLLQWLKDELLSYLQQWEKSVEKREGFSPKAKSMMVITKETRFGIRVTGLFCNLYLLHCFNSFCVIAVNSFVELVHYIMKIPGITVFFSERLSQDPLEKFFGCQRQRGKTNENPNVQQFCKNSQALRVINGTCGNVSKGNCRGSKYAIDWEKENRPLPKRCRCADSNKCEKAKVKGQPSCTEPKQSSSQNVLSLVSLKQCDGGRCEEVNEKVSIHIFKLSKNAVS